MVVAWGQPVEQRRRTQLTGRAGAAHNKSQQICNRVSLRAGRADSGRASIKRARPATTHVFDPVPGSLFDFSSAHD
jgi:hypothetical protein